MKQNHHAAMRKIILASMIFVPSIPFILSLAIGHYYFRRSIEDGTTSAMRRIVGDHRQLLDSFLNERKADLSFICNAFSFEKLSNAETIERVFQHLQRKSHAFSDLGIFNEAGVHVAYHGPYELTGKIYKDAPWFQEVMKQGYYISDIFLGYRKIPHFIIAVAREDNGRKWAIRATIDTITFNSLVEKVRIGKTGEAYIVNPMGQLQTEPRSGGELMTHHPDKIQYPASSNEINTFINENPAGEQFLNATAWLQDKKWVLVVRQEKADAFRALHSAAYQIMLILVIGAAAILGMAFYLTHQIVGRLERMDSEKDRLSQQLIGASRLAELGEMAAGFAHEINNPLQIIKNEQSLMEVILSEMKEAGQLEESEPVAELTDSMNQIKLQISRCAEITQAILKFGRQGEPKPKPMDLKAFIPEVVAMISNKAGVAGIAVDQDISPEIPPIYGDLTQFQQVLLNLFNNALDAIGVKFAGRTGGRLSVAAGLGENGMVRVTVKDNGCGVSPENVDKIFSPFFTTKPVGKGTGLGLSVCYGIIQAMGGTMAVESEKDVGTTFSVYLPPAASGQ